MDSTPDRKLVAALDLGTTSSRCIVFDRAGLPRGIGQWPEELLTPEWTVAAGLAMYAARLGQRRETRRRGPHFWDLFTSR